MMELADMTALEAVVTRRLGSTPNMPTIMAAWQSLVYCTCPENKQR